MKKKGKYVHKRSQKLASDTHPAKKLKIKKFIPL